MPAIETLNGTVFALYGAEGDNPPRRDSFFPGADIAGQPDEVRAACEEAWTPEALADWHAKMAALPAVPA